MSFFTLKVWWGKVPTMNPLKKGGHHLASKYPLCRKNEEEPEHLLVHCPMIWGLWAAPTYVTRGVWACPLTIRDFLLCWSAFQVRKHARKFWKVAPLILIWAKFGRRNKIVFEDASFSYDRLKLLFISSLTS